MKRRLTLVGMVLTLLAAAVGGLASPASAAPPAPSANLAVPITGTATNALGQTVQFAGTFTLQRFTTVDGDLAAVGQLTGTLTNTVTGAVQNVSQQIILPIAGATGTCEILDLTLGPLDLDLLGLVVHLDQVHLTITAESGPGNLLGNLLCGIAGLLDSGGGANQLATILNRLLQLL
jgi:hypothetical protein